MDFDTVMAELEALGKERTKKIYINHGAREPLFGVTTGSMKPMKKVIKKDQPLADALYATGNYDAMYFAGVIADAKVMTKADFNRWMDGAYFYMISDYVVAVTLSESDLAQEIADEWIASGESLRRSAGWSCYCWLLGRLKDEYFSKEHILELLKKVQHEIADAPDRTKISMSNFISTVAISYAPLYKQAVEIAQQIGIVEIRNGEKEVKPMDMIQKAIDADRIGFKRKYVRC